MTLRLGKMTSNEIAEWMGLTSKYYLNHRKEKLEYLKHFCSFKEYRGGVEILEIYIPEYIKNLSEDDRTYMEFVLRNKDHLCSISGMARALINNPKTNYTQRNFKSLCYRLAKAGKRTFGQTNTKDSSYPAGLYGSRRYVWAIKVNDNNSYRFMTEAEKYIFQDIVKEYINNSQGIDFVTNKGLHMTAYREGAMTAEEYLEADEQDYKNFYTHVIGPFLEKTALQLVCATEHEVYLSQISNYYKGLNIKPDKDIQCILDNKNKETNQITETQLDDIMTLMDKMYNEESDESLTPEEAIQELFKIIQD